MDENSCKHDFHPCGFDWLNFFQKNAANRDGALGELWKTKGGLLKLTIKLCSSKEKRKKIQQHDEK
ncbi:MAG: hypothetical protein HFG47_05245 [Lachnospiraceae bacterium]|nr:hypothetical protein [Lachnospiraceae bacterium]